MSDQIHATLEQLPVQGWALIALLVGGGLVLWAAGRRLLRGGFALAGLMGGVVVGYVAARWMEMAPGAACVPALIAGAIAAGLAILAYRVAVAGGLATVLALALPVAVWSVVLARGGDGTAMGILASPEPEGPAEGPPTAESAALMDDLDRWLAGLRGSGADDGGDVEGPPASAIPLDHVRDAVTEGMGDAADALPEPLRAMAERARQGWAAVPDLWRQRLIGAAVLGASGGFVLGMLAASLSASLVTAGAGAAAWMGGAWLALARFGAGDQPWLPHTPHGWLRAWLVVALIGLAIQWTVRPRRADKPA